MDAVARWEARGHRVRVGDDEVFALDTGGDLEPVLVLHGFPSSSFDFRHVLPAFEAAGLRVLLLDLPGYGLSTKADRAYPLAGQADAVEAVAAAAGVTRCAMLTHDIGDSVGGEILARALDGTLGFEITRRVITNGSIYMDLVQLSAGQHLMLALPDAMLPPDQGPNEDLLRASLAATFGPATQPDDEELAAQWALISRAGGHRLLPRLIRYIEERRIHEPRWTGAIERHPSPLAIVWGAQDPIAVETMAHRLASVRADASLRMLPGVGHYPMIEDPDAFATATLAGLGASGPA